MKNDQIFTPSIIVSRMLDRIQYRYHNLRKTIFEPSFGNGNILVEIVGRVIDWSDTKEEVLQYLDNIYGCEIDPVLYQETINRLNAILKRFKITYDWPNLVNCDALDYPARKFDYVVGNPPYVRIHDLDAKSREKLSKFQFCTGTTDLYITFFELGVKHLKRGGELVYITPNSFLKNASQRKFREYISPYVSAIDDYAAFPVFKGIGTYTCITHIMLKNNNDCRYTKFKNFTTSEFSVDVNIAGDSEWRFMKPNDAEFIDKLSTRPRTLGDICDIRNGVATNADKVYIDPVEVEARVIRPAIKASTLEDHTILFPYIDGAEPIPEIMMRTYYPKAMAYLDANRALLENRDMESNIPWYAYARSQGLRDINHPKFVLQHVISPESTTCAFREVSADTIVYGGLFLIAKNPKDIPYIRYILDSEEFCRYCKLIGKDMAGGYKSVNVKIIKSFPIK